MYTDALHDVCLTGYGYLPIWAKFNIVRKATSSINDYRAFTGLYNKLKTLELPGNRKWGDFLPLANPATAWDVWAAEARVFLPDRDAYVSKFDIPEGEDWSHAHDDAGPVFSQWMRQFAEEMNLCSLYDALWPRVAFNYRVLKIRADMDKEMYKMVLKNKESYSTLPPLEWLD